VLDDAPMTFGHDRYWLLASGGTLLDGLSVTSLGIALPLFGATSRSRRRW
jgi:putative MFS transporter